jgi:hypothetical protein
MFLRRKEVGDLSSSSSSQPAGLAACQLCVAQSCDLQGHLRIVRACRSTCRGSRASTHGVHIASEVFKGRYCLVEPGLELTRFVLAASRQAQGQYISPDTTCWGGGAV